MALVKICDICGKQCESRRRYELIEKGVFSNYTFDICCECINIIKKEIKKSSR